jgi:hypothetical protein
MRRTFTGLGLDLDTQTLACFRRMLIPTDKYTLRHLAPSTTSRSLPEATSRASQDHVPADRFLTPSTQNCPARMKGRAKRGGFAQNKLILFRIGHQIRHVRPPGGRRTRFTFADRCTSLRPALTRPAASAPGFCSRRCSKVLSCTVQACRTSRAQGVWGMRAPPFFAAVPRKRRRVASRGHVAGSETVLFWDVWSLGGSVLWR